MNEDRVELIDMLAAGIVKDAMSFLAMAAVLCFAGYMLGVVS